MDKNPNTTLIEIDEFVKKVMKNELNFFYSDNAFVKTALFEMLSNSSVVPVYYFDFDLLLSGYVSAKIIHVNDNKIRIIQPNNNNWNNVLSDVLQKISLHKSLVIIDSLNGFFTLFDKIESSKFLNSCIMLLSSLSRNTNSSVIVGAISKFNKDDGWLLVPTSRRIMESNNSVRYSLREYDSHIIIDMLEKTTEKRSFKVLTHDIAK